MMTINELAALYGVTHRALRFYESRGLLSPFRIGRQRMYSEDDAQKLSVILSAKRMGFGLEEIKPLLVRGQSGWTLAISQGLFVAGIVADSDQLHCVVASGAVKKPEDFIGKTVAFPQFSSGHYLFNKFAKKHNLPIDQIKTVRVAAPEMVAAMRRGDIDGFFCWEPWPTRAMTLIPGAHVLERAKDLGLSFSTMNYYSKALVADRDLAIAVTKGMIDATEFCQKNQAETVRLVVRDFRISDADAKDAVSKLVFRVEMNKDKMLPEMIDYANFCLEAKLIREMPKWDEFLRPEFLKAAAPDRVVGF